MSLYDDPVRNDANDAFESESIRLKDLRVKIAAAAVAMAAVTRKTPVITISGAVFGCAGDVSLKFENMQHSGSFKFRGAANLMMNTPIVEAGVTAASGGNHGAAVAYLAQQSDCLATIFVPTTTPLGKIKKMERFGATVVLAGEHFYEALEACRRFVSESGAIFFHPFADLEVIAGAGTVALEFEEQLKQADQRPLDALLASCGGGALVAASAAWLSCGASRDRTQVVACETEFSNSYAAARSVGHPVTKPSRGVAVDAIGAYRVADNVFEVMQEARVDSAVVTDAAVLDARELLWDELRILVEPAAAVPIAALMVGAWSPEATDQTGVIICGANTSRDWRPADFGQTS